MVPTHALVTRPSPQLEELATHLEQAHLKTVCMPAFRFEARERHIVPDEAWRRERNHLLLFTSPRAVAFGLPALSESMLRDGRVAAIGPATARILAEAGYEPLQAPGPDFDSEALLDSLDGRLEPGAAVILAAPGGREALHQGLEARGWSVRLVPVYERVLIDPEPEAIVALEAADRVLSFWTSGVALAHLLGKLSERARRSVRAGTAIVISERLAALARDHGIAEVRVAEGPTNEDLLRCFQSIDA